MNGRRQYMMFGIALAALLAVTLLVGMMRLDGREPAPVATIGVGQSTEVNGLRLTFVSLTDQVSVENVDQPERPAVASPGAIYAHAVFKVDVLEPRKASEVGCSGYLHGDGGTWEYEMGLSMNAEQAYKCNTLPPKTDDVENMVPGSTFDVHWYFETNPAWQQGRWVEVRFFSGQSVALRP